MRYLLAAAAFLVALVSLFVFCAAVHNLVWVYDDIERVGRYTFSRVASRLRIAPGIGVAGLGAFVLMVVAAATGISVFQKRPPSR
jgi:DMSO/TMAO reductase YedYZ heme-binding membrane subunit